MAFGLDEPVPEPVSLEGSGRWFFYGLCGWLFRPRAELGNYGLLTAEEAGLTFSKPLPDRLAPVRPVRQAG